MPPLPAMAQLKRKFLLMGKSGAGKTSMRSIVFANYVARDTERLGPTIDIERSQIRFLGDMVLSLWDCGGQDAFMDNFLHAHRENVFNDVAVMVYVFDVQSKQVQRDLAYFQLCVQSIASRSPAARVFCLVHKMDLVSEERRDSVFRDWTDKITGVGQGVSIECFMTSIWDETLYKAWSRVVCALVPNAETMSEHLREFCEICEADEVVLFERATFLVIAHATLNPHTDAHRFEKVSNIIKQFKLSCTKSRAQFESLQLRSRDLTALIDVFTQFTCIMLITSRTDVPPAVSRYNMDRARDHFEALLDGQLNGTGGADAAEIE